MPASTPHPLPPAARHEPDIGGARGIWLTAGVFFVALAIVSVGVALLLGRYRTARPDVPQPTPVPESSAPISHWADPPGDLARSRQAQRAQLRGYGWVDRETGVVRIPIERAMELIVQRGWAGTTQPAARSTETGSMSNTGEAQ